MLVIFTISQLTEKILKRDWGKNCWLGQKTISGARVKAPSGSIA